MPRKAKDPAAVPNPEVNIPEQYKATVERMITKGREQGVRLK